MPGGCECMSKRCQLHATDSHGTSFYLPYFRSFCDSQISNAHYQVNHDVRMFHSSCPPAESNLPTRLLPLRCQSHSWPAAAPTRRARCTNGGITQLQTHLSCPGIIPCHAQDSPQIRIPPSQLYRRTSDGHGNRYPRAISTWSKYTTTSVMVNVRLSVHE